MAAAVIVVPFVAAWTVNETQRWGSHQYARRIVVWAHQCLFLPILCRHIQMMKTPMKNEIRWNGTTMKRSKHWIQQKRVIACLFYYATLSVRARTRHVYHRHTHTHAHFVTIRLIEQNIKWFISFGLLNWEKKCVCVVLHFGHTFFSFSLSLSLVSSFFDNHRISGIVVAFERVVVWAIENGISCNDNDSN